MTAIDFLQLPCACGKKLKAPATAVGRKARCPACGSTLLITADAAIRSSASAGRARPATPSRNVASVPNSSTTAVSSESDDSYDLNDLDALSQIATRAESAPLPPDRPRCAQCKSAMAENAVLCVNCGYDARSGKNVAAVTAKKVKSAPTAAGKKAKAPIDRMAPDGSFVAGLAFSAAFALAASVLWVVIAYATGFTIGYIAILIGGAAGVGMQVGHKGYSTAGGYTAAALTLVAILAAKVAVIQLILARHGIHKSLLDLDSAKLGIYFMSPIGLIIIAVGMAAAYRTASGSVRG